MSLRDDGVVELRFKPRATLDVEQSRQLVRTMAALVGAGQTAPLMVIMGGLSEHSPEGREYFSQSDEAASVATRVAIVVGSLTSSVMGNLFIYIYKPRIPTRLFTDETNTLRWLWSDR